MTNCTKKHPHKYGQTDGRTDRRTDKVKPVYLLNFVGGGYNTIHLCHFGYMQYDLHLIQTSIFAFITAAVELRCNWMNIKKNITVTP